MQGSIPPSEYIHVDMSCDAHAGSDTPERDKTDQFYTRLAPFAIFFSSLMQPVFAHMAGLEQLCLSSHLAVLCLSSASS
jgi:hypothetical protein